MNVKELYNVITQQMTPEQALMKLLEGGVIQYEHLKFNGENPPLHPEMLIPMAAMELGWTIAIPTDSNELKGMIVGTQEYIDSILKK